MRYFASVTCLLVAIMVSANLWARPPKGFNVGPYLYLEGGMIQADFDRNVHTGQDFGDKFEPAIGLTFGWNIWDFFSAEMEGRYSTDNTAGRREHLASGSAYGKYFLILDALTDFDTLRIMPTVKAGISFHIASLPGDPDSADTAVTAFGWGPSFGAGLSFIVKKYIFFGFDAKEDLLFFGDLHQDLTGATNVLIYKGGFHPQFSAMGFLGVHF